MSTSLTFLSGNKLETISFDSVSSIRPTFRNEVTPVEATAKERKKTWAAQGLDGARSQARALLKVTERLGH
jgi:hypothetical protein